MNAKITTLLYLEYLILAMFMSSLSIVMLQLVISYGIDVETAGKLGVLKAICTIVPSFGSVYILKVGYKKSMLIGLFGLIFASLLIALFEGVWAIVLLFAIGGLSHTLIKLSVYSTIGLIARTSTIYAGLMNRVEGAYVIGSLTGPLLFSWMIRYGSWRSAFWIIAGLIAFTVVLLARTTLDEREATAIGEKPSFTQMRVLLRYPLVWVALASAALYGMLELGFRTWLPTFHTEVFRLPEEQSILFLSLFAGSIALSRFSTGYLQQRFSWLAIQLTYLLGAMFITLIVLLLSRLEQFAIVLATLFSLVGFFLGSAYPMICSIILSQTQKARQSAMSGLLVLATELGIALGIWSIGSLSKHFSIHTAFYFALLPMVGLSILLVSYNHLATAELES